MAPKGVKRKGEPNNGPEKSPDFLALQKETAGLKEKLSQVQNELGLTVAAKKHHEEQAVVWKRLHDQRAALQEEFLLMNPDQRLQDANKKTESVTLSLQLAQRELKGYKGKLKQGESYSARAETAEKKLDALSAGLNDIEQLANEIHRRFLKGKGSGGVQGVMYVLHAVENKLKGNSKDNTNLRQKLTAAEKQRGQATEQVEELVARESSLQQKLKNAECERGLAIAELRADLERALGKHEVAEGELTKSRGEVVVLQQKVEAAEEQRGKATEQVEELVARESGLQQKLENAECERGLAIAELRADLERALGKHEVSERELEKSAGEVALLQQRVELAEAQRGEAVKQLEELVARESGLQQKLKDVESERDSALGVTAGLRADLERALGKHEKTEGELKQSKGNIAVFQQKVEAAEAQRGEAARQVEELVARESGLQQKLKHAESERGSALGVTEGLRADLEQALEKHEVVEGELKKRKGDIAVLQQKVEAADAQMGEASKQVEELTKHAESERDSAIRELKADLERAMEKHAVAEGVLKGELAVLQQRMDAAVTEAGFERGRLHRAEKTVIELETQLQDTNQQVERMGGTVRVAECQKKAAVAEAVVLRQQMVVALQNLKDARTACARELEARAAVERRLQMLMFTRGVIDVDLEKQLQTTEEVFCATVVRAEQVLAKVSQSQWHQNED